METTMNNYQLSNMYRRHANTDLAIADKWLEMAKKMKARNDNAGVVRVMDCYHRNMRQHRHNLVQAEKYGGVV